MESEPTAYEHTVGSEDAEEQRLDWLSLPEAERVAYRTKALAHMAEAIRRTIGKSEGTSAAETATRDQRNQLLLYGKGERVPTRADYEAAAKALDELGRSSGELWERIGDLLASVELDIMAGRMMRRDRETGAN